MSILTGILMQMLGTAANNRALTKSRARNQAGADRQLAKLPQYNKQSVAAQNDALQLLTVDAPARQAELQGQRQQVFDENLMKQNAGADAARRAAAETRLTADYTPTLDAGGYAGSETAPEVVKQSIAKAMADALSDAKARAGRMAKAKSYDTARFDGAMDTARTGTALDTLTDFGRGEAGVVPFKMHEINTRIAGNNAMAGAAHDGAMQFLDAPLQGSNPGMFMQDLGGLLTTMSMTGTKMPSLRRPAAAPAR